jgi:hypothetical protein
MDVAVARYLTFHFFAIAPMPNRTSIGILAVALLVIGAAIGLSHPTGAWTTESYQGALRLGIIFAAGWLAYDDVAKLPKWLFPALVVLLFVMFRYKAFLIAVPIAAALGWLLWPRDKSSSRNRR